jgi:hypothetical protein
MLICMQGTTSVRVDRETHLELKRLADKHHLTVGGTVKAALKALRQQQMGTELAAPLRSDESAWLLADLG